MMQGTLEHTGAHVVRGTLDQTGADMVQGTIDQTVTHAVQGTLDQSGADLEQETQKQTEEEMCEEQSLCFLCGAPASMVCEYCHGIAYCSPFHLSKHRVDSTCLPFRVAVSSCLGRYLVATRSVTCLGTSDTLLS